MRMQASDAGGQRSPSAPKLIDKIDRLVAERDHEIAGRKPGEPSLAHGDSFVSERDGRHPMDVDLPRDATVAAHRIAGRQSAANDLTIRRRCRRRTENVFAALPKIRRIGRARDDDAKPISTSARGAPAASRTRFRRSSRPTPRSSRSRGLRLRQKRRYSSTRSGSASSRE